MENQTKQHEIILILDFGSQYTQLIARKVRELNVYCEIVPYNSDLTKFQSSNIGGYILSGGPSSISDKDSPKLDNSFFDTDKPILGICYGMQLIADNFGGKLIQSEIREYGRAVFSQNESDNGSLVLFSGTPQKSNVWMSHGDSIIEIPNGFNVVGSTNTLEIAAIANETKKIYGLQFHPEVHHTDQGKNILKNFVIDICKLKGDWTTESLRKETVDKIRELVKDNKVILGISGGVDSTVAAVLLSEAIGDNLHALFVNNGLLRKNEFEDVTKMLRDLNINLHTTDATDLFLDRLKGVIDPEKKRKIIGNAFIDVFEEKAEEIGGIDFLGQGTLYPDVIESVSFKGGPSVTIKSHHNVGGLKDKMKLKLVEPLRELFKDEVRKLGTSLGLSDKFIGRHPFPGPGLAVRILGEITRDRIATLQDADAIFIEELHNHNIYDDIWQAFVVLLPVQAVGVMGDSRTYENVVALRAVTSVDGMTADWAEIDAQILRKVSDRIIREVSGVNRVTYDISSKPPATIEWE